MHSDVDGAIERLNGFALDVNKYQEEEGLRCYLRYKSNTFRVCLGQRANGEPFLLEIDDIKAPGAVFPQMLAMYYTKAYGGLIARWEAHAKHFREWRSIDDTVWALFESWRVGK